VHRKRIAKRLLLAVPWLSSVHTMASTEQVKQYGDEVMAAAMSTFRGVLPSYVFAAKLAAGAFVTMGAAL
jgi:hypothetical protein